MKDYLFPTLLLLFISIVMIYFYPSINQEIKSEYFLTIIIIIIFAIIFSYGNGTGKERIIEDIKENKELIVMSIYNKGRESYIIAKENNKNIFFIALPYNRNIKKGSIIKKQYDDKIIILLQNNKKALN